jgi:peptidoglycan/LPS O-acetylase OafA/YrhL
VRFVTAVAIAVVHIAQSYFSTGWPDLVNTLGLSSVAVFFVLSGFVIRYVTRLKYSHLKEYWVDRASRIYSVVLPALLFTVVADALAYRLNPGYYTANWGAYTDHPWLRILANLTFLSQIHSHDIALFSNSPFWTLSYECLYYVLYGCFFYLAGRRMVFWLIALAMLTGVHMLLLVPVWIFGCIALEIYQWIHRRQFRFRSVNLAFAGILAAAVILWPTAVRAIFAVKNRMTLLFWAMHRRPLDLHWTTYYYRAGIPCAFLLLWLCLLMDRVPLSNKSRFTRSVRVMSEGTFPLYLFHFPLFVLIAAAVPYEHGSNVAKCLIVALSIAVGIALALPTNHLKNWMRDGMRRVFLRREPMPAPRPAEST